MNIALVKILLMTIISDFNPLLDALGLFFQIRDDYANLMSLEVSGVYMLLLPLYFVV